MSDANMSDSGDAGRPPSANATTDGSGAPTTAVTGLDPKIGAMLSYLLFGWIGGLIMYFTQKDREVRFHAAQSIIVFGAFSVLYVILSTIGRVGGLGMAVIIGLVSLLLWLVQLALWIYLSIQGYNLNHVKMPIAGDLAEQWADK